MITAETQNAIVKNILEDFDIKERREFIKQLTDMAIYEGGEGDLIEMLNVDTQDEYWRLDTALRDMYIDAFLKMHISNP